jgi:hypothetical protein
MYAESYVKKTNPMCLIPSLARYSESIKEPCTTIGRTSNPNEIPSVRGADSPILSAVQLTTLINFLLSSFQKNEPLAIVAAREFVRDEFNIGVIPNTLHNIISRDGRLRGFGDRAEDIRR